MLRKVLGEDVSDAEVLVVSPAGHQSKLAFWVSDADEAIAEAEAAQQETVERLDEQGIDAAGDTGESEPAVAIQDALAAFPADRVVVFSHPEGDRDYREDEGLAAAEARHSLRVTHALIERSRRLRTRPADRALHPPPTRGRLDRCTNWLWPPRRN